MASPSSADEKGIENGYKKGFNCCLGSFFSFFSKHSSLLHPYSFPPQDEANIDRLLLLHLCLLSTNQDFIHPTLHYFTDNLLLDRIFLFIIHHHAFHNAGKIPSCRTSLGTGQVTPKPPNAPGPVQSSSCLASTSRLKRQHVGRAFFDVWQLCGKYSWRL